MSRRSPSPLATSRREQRRALQADVGRTQLLDAAEEVFGSKGYHEATLREVAELAEFSVGSVYSFFEGKEELLRQVFLRRGDDFLAGLRDAVAGDGPPADQLRRLVTFQVGFFRDHPHFGRLYLRTASPARPVPGEVETNIAKFDEVMALGAGVVEAGQGAGAFRSGDVGVLLSVIGGIVTSYLAVDPAVITGGTDRTERFPVDDLVELVLAAFAAPKGRRR